MSYKSAMKNPHSRTGDALNENRPGASGTPEMSTNVLKPCSDVEDANGDSAARPKLTSSKEVSFCLECSTDTEIEGTVKTNVIMLYLRHAVTLALSVRSQSFKTCFVARIACVFLSVRICPKTTFSPFPD